MYGPNFAGECIGIAFPEAPPTPPLTALSIELASKDLRRSTIIMTYVGQGIAYSCPPPCVDVRTLREEARTCKRRSPVSLPLVQRLAAVRRLSSWQRRTPECSRPVARTMHRLPCYSFGKTPARSRRAAATGVTSDDGPLLLQPAHRRAAQRRRYKV